MTELTSIVAISNPRSGRNKRGGFEKFNQLVVRYHEISHLITTHEDELIQILDRCRHGNVRTIIVNGGDGTLLHLLTYLKQEQNSSYHPYLVLLQAGTTSMAYGDVGCKGDLQSIIKKLIDFTGSNADSLKQTVRQVLQMTLPEENKTVCGMFFGAGVIYNGILYCRQNIHTKGVRGELGPTMAMIRYLFDWMTFKKLTTYTQADVEYDQTQISSGEYSIITATTLKRLLAGVFPFWGTSVSQNYFYLTLVNKNAPSSTKSFINILRGRAPGKNMNNNSFLSVCPSHAELKIHDGFTLDGELFGAKGIATNVIIQSAGDVTFLTT